MTDKNLSRRSVLGSLAGFGTLSTVGVRTVRAQPTEKDRPNRYGRQGTQGDSLDAPTYFRHLLDTTGGRAGVQRYERTGATAALVTPALRRELNKNRETVNLQIQTTGRRSPIRSRGPLRRELNGWQPTPAEIRRLAEYGEVGPTPEVASTKVPVAGVSVDDIAEIADLPFVLQLNHDPEVQGTNDTKTTSEVTTTSSTPTADDIRSSAHANFDAVSASTDVKLGAFFGGYSDSGPVVYSENWAETVGIDTGLAKDFTDTEGWRGNDRIKHGTKVLNTAAYFLKPFVTRSDQLVPLRVFNDREQDDVYASIVGNAIDYAITNDIAAGVCSLLLKHNVSACTSAVCPELDSYAAAGYTMAVASGSQDLDDSVDDPASSYFTVGVGAYGNSTQDGFNRYTYSQSGTVDLRYCPWCADFGGYDHFCPSVYGPGDFTPTYNTDGSLIATSMAAPVVAAGSAIDISVHPGDAYTTRLHRYHGMNNYPIYDESTSILGDAFWAPDVE